MSLSGRHINGIAIVFALPFLALLMFTSFLQPAPQRHERAAMETALRYLDTLPADARGVLFPDNQPQVQAITKGEAGRDALDSLRALRPDRYRPARFGPGALQIVVLPSFLGTDAAERKELLTKYGVSADFAAMLSPLPATHPPCSAFLGEADGWAWGGFVFVDPQAGLASQEAVRTCVIAGFDYLLGVPVAGGEFDWKRFPDPAASLVLLDHVRQCAHSGETDRVPPLRNNRGITSLPSLSCIRAGIAAALAD